MVDNRFEEQFASLVAQMPALAGHQAQWSLEFRAEASDFVRLNQGVIRQPGHVKRAQATVRLFEGQRHAVRVVALSGDVRQDCLRIADAIAALRQSLPTLVEDPFFSVETAAIRSRRVQKAAGAAPFSGTAAAALASHGQDSAREIVSQIVPCISGLDLVGLLCSGPRARGLANCYGVQHWHEVDGYSFDFSLHYGSGALRGRAAKNSMHGRTWSQEHFEQQLEKLCREHALLAMPSRRAPTGDVRAFLMPAAVESLLGLVAWGGFAASDRMARSSPLQRLVDGQAQLSENVSLHDDVSGSDAAGFNADGFLRTTPLSLVDRGMNTGAICNPRTAREYGIAHTGADHEQPEALQMLEGALSEQDGSRALGTGLFVNRLWYLNWSDRQSARMTGMTRFATWWVEDGKVVGPVDPMRFDDSIYRMLGSSLEGLTRERQLIGDDSTYDERSLRTALVPGLLLSNWRLVS